MSIIRSLARCPGTCGEWIQGAKAETPFLIDCPIEKFVEVAVYIDKTIPCQTLNNKQEFKWKLPKTKRKVIQVLGLLKQAYQISYSGKIEFLAELPVGKGMASSTADIAAVTAGVISALGKTPYAEEIAKFALKIEPSDSIMFPGITELAHIDGSYYRNLGPVIPARFLALDWGGQIDTIAFNSSQSLIEHYRRYQAKMQQVLELFYDGLEHRDLEKMARAGTLSASYNQEINFKAQFKSFRQWVINKGGLGVVTAHSGTLLAGVFPVEGLSETGFLNIMFEAKERFNPHYLELLTAGNGGVAVSNSIID